MYDCRRRIKTEEKAKVVAAGWGTYLNAALTAFSSKGDLNKSFWENIHFGKVVVWCGVNRMIIHFYKASIPPSKTALAFILFILFFKSFWV